MHSYYRIRSNYLLGSAKQSKIESVMGGLLSGKKEEDKTGEGERGKNAVVRPPFRCNPYVLRRIRCDK